MPIALPNNSEDKLGTASGIPGWLARKLPTFPGDTSDRYCNRLPPGACKHVEQAIAESRLKDIRILNRR